MAFDLKAATPDTAMAGTEHLFGADSQSDADPKIYTVAGLKGYLDTLYQPVDSDLTAIAALTTTSFGRGLLALANAAAARTALELGTAAQSATGDFAAAGHNHDATYQPLDSDLTAIAALTTTSFGRSVLEAANAAGLFGTIKQAATDSATGVVEKAVASEVRAATADKYISADLIESASAAVALTDAATVAVDWDAAINFTLEITTNRVLGNPTNGQPGTWRTVLVDSDGGPDTLTFGNQYGGELPTLDDITTTKAYLLSIYCKSATQFLVTAIDGSDA